MSTKPSEELTPPPPSFKGRLQLQDFMFTTPPTQPPRRSPRLSTPIPTTTSPNNSKQSPPKRKAPIEDPFTPSALSPGPSSKKKRPRQKSSYAAPSTYAHLPLLPDAIAPNLILLFIGLNPGIQTAQSGHAYAHPSNLFWKLLFKSGITPVACRADEDRTLPARFALGNTNIVARPSRNGAELKKAELDAGVEVLERKVRRWRPEAVCIVGKSIWESLWRVRHGRGIGKGEFQYGWQGDGENMGVLKEGEEADVEDGVRVDEDWKGARVFVASSTSGLAATLSPAEKQTIWRELGVWVEERRKERGGLGE